jgi:Amt family ammonium transporter
VHISSGLAAVAYAMVVGKRRDYDENVNSPHNVSFVFLGLALMWFGWFGFNAGSALAANARGVQSLIGTHLSACVAAIVWVLLDYRHTRKWSMIGLCTGAVAGLATITPGSGFVSSSSALAFGAIGSFVCNLAVQYKHKYHFDDALDVFAGGQYAFIFHFHINGP